MGALRRIEPMSFPDIAPPKNLGRRPDMRWVDPRTLLVDETYQRELNRQSRDLIKKVAVQFSWSRMKPPIAVPDGKEFHLIDGQHTAIAAASIGLKEIPIFVVAADDHADRAKAFIGHNNDRIKVGGLQMHKALLAAGDENAQDIANVCKRAGIRLRTSINYLNVVEIGDTTAINLIGALIRRRGVQRARRVLEACVKGQLAPIGGHEIRAAEVVLCDRRIDVTPDALGAAIVADGERGMAEARKTAMIQKRLIRDVLADRWQRRLETVS